MRIAVVATCNLNQWAMDFDGNYQRIVESIERARASGAKFRVGPELEVPGYGCEDHFLEPDTFEHSWQVIAELLKTGLSHGMLLDLGLPVMHQGVSFNCRVLLLDREVVLVRPKMHLANDGNYREARWFRAWPSDRAVEQYVLPEVVRAATKSRRRSVPIGPAILECYDGTSLACESCEELWVPDAPHITYGLAGVDIISNASASHHRLRKLQDRIRLIMNASLKSGLVYIYANQIGCDGGRLYYDGSSMIFSNGQALAQCAQFTLETTVQVASAAIDLDENLAHRLKMSSRAVQAAEINSGAAKNPLLHRVKLTQAFSLLTPNYETYATLPLQNLRIYTVCEEIMLGPACWLWDYLRRSGMAGFFLPLSGGADSAATALIVGGMCRLLFAAMHMEPPDEYVARDKERLLVQLRALLQLRDGAALPESAKEIAAVLLFTAYMGNPDTSSPETRERADKLATQIGAWHCSLSIHDIVNAFLIAFMSVQKKRLQPRFRVNQGSRRENLALQNIQARVRMVLAYLFAQLLPWAAGRNGTLLVLGSSNVDEALRGYLTKYDCSSADLNPIGGISKQDLRDFLIWAADPKTGLEVPSLASIVQAPPSAELEPLVDGRLVQTDEQDMGLTYEELSFFGKMRKIQRCGPLAMFRRVRFIWVSKHISTAQVASKIKYFFKMYAINRHKMTTLTPSYHAEDYSPEDNRFDLRQFLYNTKWTWQFRQIDKESEMDLSPKPTGYQEAVLANNGTLLQHPSYPRDYAQYTATDPSHQPPGYNAGDSGNFNPSMTTADDLPPPTSLEQEEEEEP